MRVLLLCHGFNSLTQRLFVELRERGHAVSVEFDIADAVTDEAVELWRPELLVAPFLKRRIPESVWRRVPCMVVHPGPPGDRGPAALDHAILDGHAVWGVTVLRAVADFDAGPVWAAEPFAMRAATKSSLYRREVGDAALRALLRAIERFEQAGRDADAVAPLAVDAAPVWRDALPQGRRAIDWAAFPTARVLRHLHAADGSPGVADALFGVPCRLFDAHAASAATLARAAPGAPGDVVAKRGPALLRRTVDGGVWIGHVRFAPAAPGDAAPKLEATLAFAAAAAALPELPVPFERPAGEWDEIRYDESGADGARVGWLDFDFHNGALGTRQCRRLLDALQFARARDTQVLVLAGGAEFFCNGIHLHDIEAAAARDGDSAADASMRNIEAIDDVALAILSIQDRLTVAALRGNAGAGGCFLALAADAVWAHAGVVQNPHYKNMGNLYGSEYWTYLLPRRVGPERSTAIMQGRLPIGAADARALGLVDAVVGDSHADAEAAMRREALALAASPDLAQRVEAKRAARAADEAAKPLAAYRAEELARMQRNFYGFDPSYHVARHHFVTRKPMAWTPRHLAVHR